MRIDELVAQSFEQVQFLSIQAQDFIEDGSPKSICMLIMSFLSIQAQDFIEETGLAVTRAITRSFLSIQAQDFIEDSCRIDEWGILSDS